MQTFGPSQTAVCDGMMLMIFYISDQKNTLDHCLVLSEFPNLFVALSPKTTGSQLSNKSLKTAS